MFKGLLRGKICKPVLLNTIRRFASHENVPLSKNSTATSQSKTFQQVVARTPRFLQPSFRVLHDAPITHLTAFLILHELTAIIPLFGLAGAFHYYNWLPTYFVEGAWVNAGIKKFCRYFCKKGWISSLDVAEVEKQQSASEDSSDIKNGSTLQLWDTGNNGMRWVIELATAYAIVKVLLPVRIVASVWGAPWFARWTVEPVRHVLKLAFGRKARVTGQSSHVLPKK